MAESVALTDSDLMRLTKCLPVIILMQRTKASSYALHCYSEDLAVWLGAPCPKPPMPEMMEF
jgi:hypothetical protein